MAKMKPLEPDIGTPCGLAPLRTCNFQLRLEPSQRMGAFLRFDGVRPAKHDGSALQVNA